MSPDSDCPKRSAADVAERITAFCGTIDAVDRRAAYRRAVREWEQWEDQAAENERAHADALRAILAERPGGPLKDEKQRPGDGWEWQTDTLTEFPIVDGESKYRSRVATGWVPPRVVAWRNTPKDWPQRTPSLDVTLLILSLYHDLALPRAPRLMDDTEVEDSGAVEAIHTDFRAAASKLGDLEALFDPPVATDAQASAREAREWLAHAERLLREHPLAAGKAKAQDGGDAGGGAGGQPDESRSPPPLTDRAAAVYELLKALPPHRGMKGPAILDGLGKQDMLCDQSTLTKRIIPALRRYGVVNKPGVGYYIDPSKRRKDSAANPS